ncbi:MAG TPA: PRC-barrel domain-containing protein [Baekduia sp.]|uniref:PRC-barrel domain-containing protein n=1 Tax=Baekduia sp. TaxID=2600305 RepID=UPI002D79B218|nr:PRC-barrel domain-containing protein [Baekduia sp.]HET6506074.1 PRC-barrel domain-containing protein [Baekduia sp.]
MASFRVTTIAVEDVKDWCGQDVLDPTSDKLGKLDDVYYDVETDRPAFAAVRSGTLSKHLTLVPLDGATVGRDYVRVAIAKDRFKGAPSFSPDMEMIADEEAKAYEYYGLDYAPGGLGSARRLARH